MNKIHTQKLVNGEGYCFFDAGEIEVSFINKFSLSFLKKDSPIFQSNMFPGKVYILKGVLINYRDSSAFDIDSTIEDSMLVCFDPRIIMVYTLLAWILEKEDFNDFIKIGDLQKVLTPLPTMNEAKTFLKKNKSLIDVPIFEAHTEGRVALENLIDVPAKVRKLFDKKN